MSFMIERNRILNMEFDDSVQGYNYIDGLFAIGYYLYLMVILYVFGVVSFKTDLMSNMYRALPKMNEQFVQNIYYIPVTIIMLLPVFIMMLLKKQKWDSIGIKGTKIAKSIALGILFSIPLVAPSFHYAILNNKKFIPVENMIWLFLYFFIEIALVEEISYRGFIQTRIQGLIKSKWLSIITVGVLFALSHIPFQMVRADKSLLDFIVQDSVHLLLTCAIHIYLVYLYTRDNNILSAIVAHALIDFVPGMFY